MSDISLRSSRNLVPSDLTLQDFADVSGADKAHGSAAELRVTNGNVVVVHEGALGHVTRFFEKIGMALDNIGEPGKWSQEIVRQRADACTAFAQAGQNVSLGNEVPFSSESPDPGSAANQTLSVAGVRAAMVKRLVGCMISPEAAKRLENKVTVDHLGRITAPGPDYLKLTVADLNTLVKDVVSDLTRTNTAGDRDEIARTRREIVLDFLGGLRAAMGSLPPGETEELLHRSDLLHHFQTGFKSLWLSSSLNDAPLLSAWFDSAAAHLHGAYPELAAKARELNAEAAKPTHNTQRHDNTFGRKFESEFINTLVKSPPPRVLAMADKVGQLFVQHYKNNAQILTEPNSYSMLAESIQNDPRPWHSELPELAAFVKSPSLATFAEMMANPSRSGYGVINQSYIGVKASVVLRGPWKATADDNYGTVVTQGRSATSSVLGAGAKQHPALLLSFEATLDQSRDHCMRVQRTNPSGSAPKQQADAALKAIKQVRTKLESRRYAAGDADALRLAFEEAETSLRTLIAPDSPFYFLADQAHDAATRIRDMAPEQALELATANLSASDQKILADAGLSFSPAKTNDFGTRLPHHLPNEHGKDWESGKSVQAGVHVNLKAPKPFENNALQNDQNTVVGPSGSTNMMTFLYLHMMYGGAGAPPDPTFSLSDAFAGTMMFLTFDGGHSLPESLGTYYAILADARVTYSQEAGMNPERQAIFENRRAALNSFVLDYNRMTEFFISGETKQAVANAIDTAFEKTRAQFDEVHAQRLV